MENKPSISVTEICEITGVKKSTLRAWRNRNGLLPHLPLGEGWTRYTLEDAISILFVSKLTNFGMDTQAVVNLANRMRKEFEETVGGGDRFFIVDEPISIDASEFRVLDFHRIEQVNHYQLKKSNNELFLVVNTKVFWLEVLLNSQKK
jgi:DNA-binding transcriptional MerR regulator